MGCGTSKLEEQEAVAHCRQRSILLAEAIRERYNLADAHAAYTQSLKSVSISLYNFLNTLNSVPAPPSPLLTLPTQRKGDPAASPIPPPVVIAGPSSHSRPSHNRSNSGGSHIHFQSSDSDTDADSHIHFHSDEDEIEAVHSGPTQFNISYARNQPAAPSVSFEQRVPNSSETVYPSFNNYPSYPPQSSSSNPYPYPSYPPYPPYPNYGDMGGFFGSGPVQNNVPPPVSAPREEEPPPPPPEPPSVSTWDFLNPFDSYDSYYAPPYAATPYTPSRSSKDVREEEGIPDLEDEHEVVKEAYGDQKLKKIERDEGPSHSGEDPHRKSRSLEVGSSSTSGGNGVAEQEIHVVEKSVVGDEGRRSVTNLPPPKSYNDDLAVVNEIKAQFQRTCESADLVAKMLEVGKQPYQQKNSVFKASVRMICGLPSTSGSDEELLQFEEDKALGCGNLSSTLQKLYMWEKKLLDEVKEEEKMRVLYEKKCEELRHLDERGAEPSKIDSTQSFIRKLSTRISVAIHVVNSISDNISTIRDQELWPQICEIIQGFVKMWRAMLECHHIQCQAVSSAKNIDSILTATRLAEPHIEATKQLELELLDWIASFSAWVSAQRSCIKTLNSWLVKGLNYVPEVTEDGTPPFSPGRLGAPPVFVICNQWSNSIHLVSESDVVRSMKAFASEVFQLWERHQLEQRQALMANRDNMDRAIRSMERDEQLIRKAIEMQNRKLEMNGRGSSGGAHLAETEPKAEGGGGAGSLQVCLKRVFEAMEGFTAASVKVYEDLNLRAEEEKKRENSKVS